MVWSRIKEVPFAKLERCSQIALKIIFVFSAELTDKEKKSRAHDQPPSTSPNLRQHHGFDLEAQERGSGGPEYS